MKFVARHRMVPRHHFFRSRAELDLRALTTGQMANPFQFLQEVRQEADKVTWPNRRETTITTVLVVIMCVFASLFLFAVDQGIHIAINIILGFGR